MQQETFTAKVIEAGRITIPEVTRKVLGIGEGDVVQVQIRKRMSKKVTT